MPPRPPPPSAPPKPLVRSSKPLPTKYTSTSQFTEDPGEFGESSTSTSRPSDSSHPSTSNSTPRPRPLPSPQARPNLPPPPPKQASFSWSRPFAFAFRPKTLFYYVIPLATVLHLLDPLNANEGIRDRIERYLPTSGPPEQTEDKGEKESGVEQVGSVPVPAGAPVQGEAVKDLGDVKKDGAKARSDDGSRSTNTVTIPSTNTVTISSTPSSPIARTTPQRPRRPPLVLGLESSADDSCAAIIDGAGTIHSNVVIKQHEWNAVYGGIYPLKAQSLHAANVPRAIRMALDEAGVGVEDLDAVAYTRGPGMAGCLGVSAASAKAIAAVHNLPLLGIHHMQAHALTPLLTEPEPPTFPFLTVLVSGGHTQLVLARSLGSYSILADCMDARIGDAFDKVARVLQLPSSNTQGSGAVLERFAAMSPLTPFDQEPLKPLPVPLSSGEAKRSLAFSFSGLVTQTNTRVSNLLAELGRTEVPENIQRAVSRAFQTAAITHLTDKVRLALASPELADVRGVVVSGGVASNQAIRQRLREVLDQDGRSDTKLYYPPISFCTDNAAMIAWTAVLRLQNGAKGEAYNLPLRPKWSLEDLYDDL